MALIESSVIPVISLQGPEMFSDVSAQRQFIAMAAIDSVGKLIAAPYDE